MNKGYKEIEEFLLSAFELYQLKITETISTNSDGNINPTRDGVFARVRSAMLPYGSAATLWLHPVNKEEYLTLCPIF